MKFAWNFACGASCFSFRLTQSREYSPSTASACIRYSRHETRTRSSPVTVPAPSDESPIFLEPTEGGKESSEDQVWRDRFEYTRTEIKILQTSVRRPVNQFVYSTSDARSVLVQTFLTKFLTALIYQVFLNPKRRRPLLSSAWNPCIQRAYLWMITQRSEWIYLFSARDGFSSTGDHHVNRSPRIVSLQWHSGLGLLRKNMTFFTALTMLRGELRRPILNGNKRSEYSRFVVKEANGKSGSIYLGVSSV